LIGNKIDLEKRRRISPEEGKALAEENSLRYFECSAKDYEGVDAAFQYLGKTFFDMYNESSNSIQQLE